MHASQADDDAICRTLSRYLVVHENIFQSRPELLCNILATAGHPGLVAADVKRPVTPHNNPGGDAAVDRCQVT